MPTFDMDLSKMSSKFSSPHQESYRCIAVYSRGALKTEKINRNYKPESQPAKLFNIHRQADYVLSKAKLSSNFPSSNIKEGTDLVPLTV